MLLSALLSFQGIQALAWDEQRYQSIRESIVSYFDNHKSNEFGLVAKEATNNSLAEGIAREFESKDDDKVNQLFDRIQILIKWRYLEPKGNFADFISSDAVDYQLIYFAFLSLVVQGGDRLFEKTIASSNGAEIYSDSGLDQKIYAFLISQRAEDLKNKDIKTKAVSVLNENSDSNLAKK
jgi:hypothetical protein